MQCNFLPLKNGLAYKYQSTFQVSLNSGETVFFLVLNLKMINPNENNVSCISPPQSLATYSGRTGKSAQNMPQGSLLSLYGNILLKHASLELLVSGCLSFYN